jgi:outer membrane exchange protein TraA
MSNNRFLIASVASVLALTSSVAMAAPVVIPEGVGDALPGQGTGLCSAAAISTSPSADFGLLNPAAYTGSVNAFIEAHASDRIEAVIRTLLDLSNNNSAGLKQSYGDFVDAALPLCKTGGCDFVPTEPIYNDTTTSFGMRLRGYFNVTADLANKPIHFGFYTDDAVSLTFYGANAATYGILTRPAEVGFPVWRVTEQVTFLKAGLYPLEILYIEIGEHAALEMSYFVGSYVDFERPANQPPILTLNNEGFTLFPPTAFFQTLSGNPSFPDLNVCEQCNRSLVNQPGNNGCVAGYYCNDAALCAPCDTNKLCGATCSPCGGDTPFCVNLNGNIECGGCRTDADCTGGFTCDPITKTCNECNDDKDCPKGEKCDGKSCQPCSTPDSCAGASCNCCPNGQFGTQMNCEAIEPNGEPLCVECTTDVECKGGVCNLAVGRCMNALPQNNTPICCGDTCVNCLALESIVIDGAQVPRYPFCLPGPIGTACAECRQDSDCGDGGFCLSGVCSPCTRDKRCGLRCDSCGGDTPYCKGQTAATAVCVRCTNNDQCGTGTCDPMTGVCSNDIGCQATCGPTTPHCNGSSCVECYADSHCPCGGTCNAGTNKCSPSCKTNVDCLGNDHCRWNEAETAKECAMGPMPDGVECGGTLATICSAQPGRHGSGAPASAILAACTIALLRRRQRRGSS